MAGVESERLREGERKGESEHDERESKADVWSEGRSRIVGEEGDEARRWNEDDGEVLEVGEGIDRGALSRPLNKGSEVIQREAH